MQAMTDIGAINPNLAVGSAAGACMRLGQSFSQNATFTPQNDLYTDMVHASW